MFGKKSGFSMNDFVNIGLLGVQQTIQEDKVVDKEVRVSKEVEEITPVDNIVLKELKKEEPKIEKIRINNKDDIKIGYLKSKDKLKYLKKHKTNIKHLSKEDLKDCLMFFKENLPN